jgi:hypothetical protein
MDQSKKENTILVYSKSKVLIDLLKTLDKENNVKYFKVKKVEDFIAVPSFMVIVDSSLLNDKIIDIFSQIVPFEQINEYSIILLGANSLKIPNSIKKYITMINENLVGLNNIIKRKYGFIKPKLTKQNQMIEKYRRIINLYVKSSSDHQLDIDQYCNEYNVTERTLRRDIKLLKAIYPDFYIYPNRLWTK